MTENPKCPVPECGKPCHCGGRLVSAAICSSCMSASWVDTKPAPALKPCPNPACGGNARFAEEDGVAANYPSCAECLMEGPCDDRDGAKWNALPRRGEYADNLIVFEKTGETRKARRGDWRELSDGLIRSWDSESQSAHEFPILRRVHPPETKPAGRIPWPEWLNDFLCIRVRTHGVHGVNIYANDALCFLGNKLWTHGPGNYRRVTVDGKDYAEKVDNG